MKKSRISYEQFSKGGIVLCFKQDFERYMNLINSFDRFEKFDPAHIKSKELFFATVLNGELCLYSFWPIPSVMVPEKRIELPGEAQVYINCTEDELKQFEIVNYAQGDKMSKAKAIEFNMFDSISSLGPSKNPINEEEFHYFLCWYKTTKTPTFIVAKKKTIKKLPTIIEPGLTVNEFFRIICEFHGITTEYFNELYSHLPSREFLTKKLEYIADYYNAMPESKDKEQRHSPVLINGADGYVFMKYTSKLEYVADYLFACKKHAMNAGPYIAMLWNIAFPSQTTVVTLKTTIR